MERSPLHFEVWMFHVERSPLFQGSYVSPKIIHPNYQVRIPGLKGKEFGVI
ncbi:MAG: hypothetical protein H7318_08720 [Oligoflexus sp.]|nr:hypothetical protein [Oligoflexus sp.]